MFTIETAFVKKTLVEWFNKKIKSQYLEIDILVKNQYERKNPINWNKDKCVIFKMPLKIDRTNHKTPSMEMSYGDFFIRFEHKFLRNIYSDEELPESRQINTLENYYHAYQKFTSICIGVLSIFGMNSNIDDNTNSYLNKFLEENFLKLTILIKLNQIFN